jgi:hypothetical protein
MDRAGWCVADAILTDLYLAPHGADTGIDATFAAKLNTIGGLAAVLFGMGSPGGLYLLTGISIFGKELQGG